MSKSKRNLLIILLLLLAGLSIWVYLNLEWVDKEIDLGPGADIRRQEYIAAQRYLEKLDVQLNVEQGFTRLDAPLNAEYDGRSDSQDPLSIEQADKHLAEISEEYAKKEKPKYFPSKDDLIVIGDGFAGLSELRAEKLLNWVEAGGHLIVTARNPFLSSTQQRPDYVFEHFGVFSLKDDFSEDETQREDEEQTAQKGHSETLGDASSAENESNENDSNTQSKPWNPQSQCHVLTDNLGLTIEDGLDIEIGLNANQALSFDKEDEEHFFFWASNDLGIQIIQARHGSGVVTFLSNIDAWKNNYIACFDNAYFLRFFAANYPQVWFLVNTDSPSLVDLVWEKYPYFLLSFFILLILSVWHFGQRFGGMQPIQPFNRRKILEHIEASSMFLWRQKSTRWLLVDAVQQSIQKKMRIRNASFDSKSWGEQCEMIAKTTQLPVQAVQTSMVELTEDLKSQTLSEQNFIILMKSLKRIEDKL